VSEEAAVSMVRIKPDYEDNRFYFVKGPAADATDAHGRTAALRLFGQPCDEDD
jgi:hypothetical protein